MRPSFFVKTKSAFMKFRAFQTQSSSESVGFSSQSLHSIEDLIIYHKCDITPLVDVIFVDISVFPQEDIFRHSEELESYHLFPEYYPYLGLSLSYHYHILDMTPSLFSRTLFEYALDQLSNEDYSIDI